MLKLTTAPEKRKFNPYKPLLVMADHPAWTGFIIGWALSLAVFFIGIPLRSDWMVGSGMILGVVMTLWSLIGLLFIYIDWCDGGGWYRVRRSLREKAERHGKIED